LHNSKQHWRHAYVTGMVTLLTDVPHIDSCAKLHKFSAILASLFVFFISLVSLILVRSPYCLE